jgi:nitroimidazol reductase NimA-like FMN-containing flavoprotein (pyridoxamine 5'-phosphate oxidase superfamily)
MPHPNDMPIEQVRRADRAVHDDAWLQQMLQTAAVGSLATVHDGQPFINTNLFYYDAARHCIYTHTARVGRTRANVEEPQTPPQVCFSVMEMGRLLPADEALEFSVEYAGVMVFGTATVVEDEAEATEALQAMLDKYAPHLTAGEDYRPPVPEELKRTTVMKIHIDKWSGKKKEVDDFAGAFWYPESPMLASRRK